MTPYLFHVFGAPGVDDLYVLRCADDAEACARANWLLTLEPGRECVEAWDEARLVGIAWAESPAPEQASAAA